MTKEEQINCTVEALILASPEPLSVSKMCDVLENTTPARIRQAVGDLNNVYLGCGSSFRIREVAGGYQVHILPDFEQPIKRLLTKQRSVRLTRAALETLAIIAYKQPVTKTEIDHIRGVASDGVLHNLLERNLIVIAGRAESAGRPLVYRTSNDFLKFFGLNRLSDLPRMEEIEEMIHQAEPPQDQIELPLGEQGQRDADKPQEDRDGQFGESDLEFEDMVAHVEPGFSRDDGGKVLAEDTGSFKKEDESEWSDLPDEDGDLDIDDEDNRDTDDGMADTAEIDLDDEGGFSRLDREAAVEPEPKNAAEDDDLIKPQSLEDIATGLSLSDGDDAELEPVSNKEKAGVGSLSDDTPEPPEAPAESGDNRVSGD